jgi:chlorobactene glucosyltransferase
MALSITLFAEAVFSLPVILSTLGMLAGLAIAYLLHSRVNIPVTVGKDEPSPLALQRRQPFVSVIVPARNEARNIRRCVEALLDQTYTHYELVVVDDRSTDATPAVLAAIVQERREEHAAPNEGRDGDSQAVMQVVQGKDPPPGWAGKPHAVSLGVEAAQGEWLCFVDADTFARPDLLRATLASAIVHQADLFTIFTDQELGSFWEKTVLPLVFTALSFGFPAERVNDPNRPEAIANGQFLLIRRDVYEAVGGHRAVRDQIAEDKALAELVKRSGYRLLVADGRELASTRMYTSFAEIWEGWTKNIFLGMRERLGLLLFGALVGLFAALALPIWLAAGFIWLLAGGGLPALVVTVEALIVCVYIFWWRARAARAFRISPTYALTLPLGALVFTAMMFASAYRVLSGQGVTWKGRRYQ